MHRQYLVEPMLVDPVVEVNHAITEPDDRRNAPRRTRRQMPAFLEAFENLMAGARSRQSVTSHQVAGEVDQGLNRSLEQIERSPHVAKVRGKHLERLLRNLIELLEIRLQDVELRLKLFEGHNAL